MKRISLAQTPAHLDETILVKGWIQKIRNHGKLIFIDLRDWTGILQLVLNSENESFQMLAKELCNEYVISVKGKIKLRKEALINEKIPTGKIELECETVEILNTSKPIPFPIDSDGREIDEQIRLKYRYLDLRRKRMHDMLHFRNEVIYFVRTWYRNNGFVEIETPLLTATSPEGSRDFIVPSRIHKGKFFVLPQAPQQFKQLLMVGGIEKYFQIAPCFRDEDPRADRHAGAFYQIDTEMAFITQEELFEQMEPLFKEMIETLTDKQLLQYPFPRLSYNDALEYYGSDKPDLRFDLQLKRLDILKKITDFSIFQQAGCIKGIQVIPAVTFSRKQIDGFIDFAMQAGAKGLSWLRMKEDGTCDGSIAKFINPQTLKILIKDYGFIKNMIIFIVADEEEPVNLVLNLLRLHLGDVLGLRDKNVIAFAWITDFPMYEYNTQEKKITFMHNPFSMPQGGLEALRTKNPLDILAYQYDIVANGLELSSGAIRNHEPETMIKAFEIAGYEEKEVRTKFGHMLDAFSYGAPPHGGFAPGIDRLIMLLRDEPNIREIYAFPLSSDARDIMMQAPSEVSELQLKEAGIELRQKEIKNK